MNRFKFNATIFIFLFVFFAFLEAETFRVNEMKTVNISITDNSAKTSIGLNDGIAINLPQDTRFLQGIQIDIKIPKDVAAYRDSIAYYLFAEVTPTPNEDEIDYNGKRQYLDTLPGRLSYTIQIPLDNTVTLKTSPYSTILPMTIGKNTKTLVFRLQLVMKGVPESFFSTKFDVEVKPILKNEGIFTLNLIYPEILTETDKEETLKSQNCYIKLI